MARFDLLYEQSFTSTDTINITHNLKRDVFNVRLVISGNPRLSQRELIEDVLLGTIRIKAITDITTVADTAGSLDGKYFILEDYSGTVAFWFDHGDTGTLEPSHGADRSVKITTIANGDSAGIVGDKIYTAILTDPEFEEGSNDGSGSLTIQNAEYGERTQQGAGDSGFTVSQSTAGRDDAINTCTVKLTGIYSGVVQIIAEDTIQSPYYTVFEKVRSQDQTDTNATFPVKFEYGGQAGTNRILEWATFADSINVPFIMVGSGELKAVVLEAVATSNGTIEVRAIRSGADILLFSGSYGGAADAIFNDLNIIVLRNDRVYVKVASGSVTKPVVIPYFKVI